MKQSDASEANTTTHTADTRNPEWDAYAPKGEGRTDEQIRADIHQALTARQNASGQKLVIDVKDGVVTLSGRVDDQDQRAQLDQLLRSIPSVRDVRDELQVGG